MRKYILLPFAIAFISLQLQAQDIPQKLLDEKWVKIMANDSMANFPEADAAFQKYYASYIKEKKKAEMSVQPSVSKMEEEHLNDPETFLIAGYIKWSISIKPFVGSDGRIMPMERRLAIIQAAKNPGSNH
jgi:hypothetical protein